LKKPPAIALAVLGLLTAVAATGEERTERMADPKGARELVYRDEVLAEERSYDPRGALREERFFDASSLPTRTRSYIRDGGRLARVELEDATGIVVGSMEYRYDRDGRLLGVDAAGELGAGSAGMISAGAVPQGSWVSGSMTTVLGYDESGHAAIVQTMKDGAVLSLERRIYAEGGSLASSAVEDRVSGLSSEFRYDGEGRVAIRTDTPAKGPMSRTEYLYNDSGRLAEETTARGGHRSSKSSSYSEDGKLVREETRRDGELLLAVDYSENGRVEELYDGGVIFVRASYSGGRKVKDEFFAAGKLLRTREYQ
jgi:antitoxin component YwqK of YwqJK toxin-antitoxin module